MLLSRPDRGLYALQKLGEAFYVEMNGQSDSPTSVKCSAIVRNPPS
jgi:hypothetical protein